VLLVSLVLAACAAPAHFATSDSALILPEAGLESELARRLVGRWEGDVDMTITERTLLIPSVRRQGGRWLVEAQYGVTNVNLTPVVVALDTTGGRVQLRFVSHVGSPVTLTLQQDGLLRGGLRQSNETRERAIELKRVSASAAVAPGSTAVERVSAAQRAREAGAPDGPAARTAAIEGPSSLAAAAPVLPSALRDLAADLPRLLVGRWDGAVELQVAERSLLIDSVTRRPAGRWQVQARYGFTEKDAGPVPTTLDLSGDRNVLLLTDRTERKPSLRNLRYALGTFLARSARKDDTVLIYFAGHGAPETDLQGAEKDGLAKYLIPSDADPDDLYASALPMDEIQILRKSSYASLIVQLKAKRDQLLGKAGRPGG